MPVIGRLDGQVEDVLINPVSKRRRAETPDAETARGPKKLTRTPPAPDSKSPEARRDDSAAETGPARLKEDLPVWML